MNAIKAYQQALTEEVNAKMRLKKFSPHPEDIPPYSEMEFDTAYGIVAEMAFGRSRVSKRDQKWALKVIDAIRERL